MFFYKKILINGYSKTVLTFIRLVASFQKDIKLFILESLPSKGGKQFYAEIKDLGISAKIIKDSMVGLIFEEVDYALSGAEVVTENGGIVNNIGTLTTAICAKNFNKPFYVLVEKFKFMRIFPFSQRDIIDENHLLRNKECNNEEYIRGNDFTPSEFITYIITDNKILSPNVVSDEVIQMFDLN